MGRMVSLGRVAAPKPINLPSQRLENNGQDPNVTLVPTGTHTWSAAGAADARQHHQHPAVARSALVAHPESDAPAWGSGATWGRGEGQGPPLRPARAESFPDLHGASAAAPSDRSLGFVDESPPGHGAHAQSAHAQSTHARCTIVPRLDLSKGCIKEGAWCTHDPPISMSSVELKAQIAS